MVRPSVVVALGAVLVVFCPAADVSRGDDAPKGREEVVDATALRGKVLCGYQGWFTAPGDGSGRGWRHYPARGQFRPGFCGIDL